jgi:hypothetical protein
MLINKRRFSESPFIDFFRGNELDESNEENRCSFLRRALLIDFALPKFLGLDVIKMAPLKDDETLHNYLRRHFEKVSKDNARQLAQLKVVTKVDVVPAMPSSEGSES